MILTGRQGDKEVGRQGGREDREVGRQGGWKDREVGKQGEREGGNTSDATVVRRK